MTYAGSYTYPRPDAGSRQGVCGVDPDSLDITTAALINRQTNNHRQTVSVTTHEARQ